MSESKQLDDGKTRDELASKKGDEFHEKYRDENSLFVDDVECLIVETYQEAWDAATQSTVQSDREKMLQDKIDLSIDTLKKIHKLLDDGFLFSSLGSRLLIEDTLKSLAAYHKGIGGAK